MDPRSPERGQYAFVQALIREVAYNTLSRKDRKKLHLAAARYFESLGTDEIAGALAGHYLAAHANAAKAPRQTHSPARRESRSRPQPNAPPRWAASTRRSRSSSRRSPLPAIRPTRSS